MTTLPASTTEGRSIPGLAGLAALSLAGLLAGCSLPFSSRPSGSVGAPWSSTNRSDPALSGDGRLLASLIDTNGRTQVLLQEQPSGQQRPLRHLRGTRTVQSPSLSWSGRYLAALVLQGAQRRVVVEDRLSGQLLQLPLPGGLQPERVSLSPDARRLAIQVRRDGQWQVQLFALDALLEPDLAGGLRIQGGDARGR